MRSSREFGERDFAGSRARLYVVDLAMVASFFFMISGSWLLLIGVRRDEVTGQTRLPVHHAAQTSLSGGR